MKNRNAFFPILCALTLSFAFGPIRAATNAAPSATTPALPSPTLTPSVGVAAKPSITAASPTAAKNSAQTTAPYTVLAGDTLTSLAKKFNTTRKKLKALNNLAATKLTPGQILQVPARKSKTTAVASTTSAKTAKLHHPALVAQPAQDFDIPASTFASCPVPVPSDDDEATSVAKTPTVEEPALILSPSAPADLREQLEAQKRAAQAQAAIMPATPQVKNGQLVASPAAKYSPAQITSSSANPFADDDSMSNPAPTPAATPTPRSTPSLAPFTPPSQRLSIRGINPSPSNNSSSVSDTAASDWGSKFIQQARLLGDKGIDYDDDWRPPGESHSWAMDCSNTSRYLYKVTAGINLPRTASDQYYYLHLQGKAWDVPQNASGFADGDFLRRNLKPGDLLFWENTYRPERQPPITHVMVFLGTNDKGQWIMAGSQSSRGGEHNRRNGGPDIYVFRPSQPCGGYTTWLGLVHHQGRFCAFGRPLEADPSKLAVAAND